MGKRGPKPKSNALKILEGTRSDRLAPPSPDVVPGAPECPKHLSAVAKAEFARLVKLLDASGVLSKADASALALYCETYSEWLEARADVKKLGRLVTSAEGTVKLNPMVAVANQCKTQMLRLLKEFGFTPSARSRVTKITAEVPQDKLEDFLSEAK